MLKRKMSIAAISFASLVTTSSLMAQSIEPGAEKIGKQITDFESKLPPAAPNSNQARQQNQALRTQPGQAPSQPAQVINQPVQAGTRTGQPLPADGLENQRYEARRVPTEASQQGPTVQEAITSKLRQANDAEIELAEMAQERSDNDEVKELAKTIVKDHEALNQKLQSGKQGQGKGREDKNITAANAQAATVPEQLCKIGEQACQNALEMTKEMLSKKEGQNFNMAFLGQQIFAHTMMLAELKAIESVGPQELQSVAQEAIQKTESHLKTAKELAMKLEDDRKKS